MAKTKLGLDEALKGIATREGMDMANKKFQLDRSKADQDGDGDTDYVDAKVAQYQKGGIKKGQAIAKAKMFAKKNNIKDSIKGANTPVKEGFFNRWTKPSIDQAAHDSVRGQGHSHRGNDDGEYIMFDGQKFSQDQIEYADLAVYGE